MSQAIGTIGVLEAVDSDHSSGADAAFDQIDDLTLASAIMCQTMPHLFGEPWDHPHAAPVAARSQKMAEAA